MKNEPKDILERIFSLSNTKLVLEVIEDCHTNQGWKRDMVIRDINDEKKHMWLKSDTDSSDSMKFDKLYLTAEDGEDEDMVYAILLEYIRENGLFTICEEDKDGNTHVRFKIPTFTNQAELQIKLDMMI